MQVVTRMSILWMLVQELTLRVVTMRPSSVQTSVVLQQTLTCLKEMGVSRIGLVHTVIT
jgi:hypothetical protein